MPAPGAHPLLNQARDTVWPKFFDQIEHLEPDTVLDAIEHALDRGEFFVFPGKGTRLRLAPPALAAQFDLAAHPRCGGYAMSELVLLSLEGSLGMITLNRPKAANALSTEVMEAIIAKAQAVSRESAVRVVILTGAGKHLRRRGPPREARRGQRPRAPTPGPAWGELPKALRAIPQLTICAVEGAAMGGGACMATACDFRIAGETARFAYPEIDRGMNLQWGGLALCLRLIGPARTKQMVGLGDDFAAPQLESWGYVDAVTAPGEALAEARRWAARATRPSRPLRCR